MQKTGDAANAATVQAMIQTVMGQLARVTAKPDRAIFAAQVVEPLRKMILIAVLISGLSSSIMRQASSSPTTGTQTTLAAPKTRSVAPDPSK